VTDPGSGEVVVDQETQKPVEDPAQIEKWTDWVAARAGQKPPESGQIKTPDSIIADLELMGHLAAQNVRILREGDKTRRAARRLHARARLVAVKAATGKDADTRKLEAEVATEAEWEAADNAEIAYEYAKSVAELVRSRTSAVQTMAKQVELTFQLAGRGRN
jgi:hypothetical protein